MRLLLYSLEAYFLFYSTSLLLHGANSLSTVGRVILCLLHSLRGYQSIYLEPRMCSRKEGGICLLSKGQFLLPLFHIPATSTSSAQRLRWTAASSLSCWSGPIAITSTTAVAASRKHRRC